jgi:hypothetical protein
MISPVPHFTNDMENVTINVTQYILSTKVWLLTIVDQKAETNVLELTRKYAGY